MTNTNPQPAPVVRVPVIITRDTAVLLDRLLAIQRAHVERQGPGETVLLRAKDGSIREVVL